MKKNSYEINKLVCIFMMIILLIINSIASYKALNGDFSLSMSTEKPSSAVIILSWLGLITLFCSVYTWNKVHKEIICPYIIFFFSLYIYCYGQSFCWVFGFENFYKDLVLRETQYFIVQAQAYTLPFLSLFHLMALVASGNSNTIYKDKNKFMEIRNKALFLLGIFFVIVSIPAFFINLYSTVKLVANYGYGGIYYNRPEYSRFINILLYARQYFAPAIVCILVSKYKNRLVRNWMIGIFIINIVTSLYIGGRSGAVVSVLCIICIWHYIVKPINKKQGLVLAGGAYIFAGILNAVAVVRGKIGHGLSDIINTFSSAGLNVIGDFLGEVGWSLTSVGYTIQFVPTFEPFRYGSTYLYGLSTIIPNLGFWDLHPATANAHLSQWLQSMLNINYGPGYTLVAETYINFGWFGIAFAGCEGAILGWMLSRVNKITARDNLTTTAFIIIFLIVVLQSIVRSSFVVAFRDYAYVLGIMYFVYMCIYNHYKSEYLKSDNS